MAFLFHVLFPQFFLPSLGQRRSSLQLHCCDTPNRNLLIPWLQYIRHCLQIIQQCVVATVQLQRNCTAAAYRYRGTAGLQI